MIKQEISAEERKKQLMAQLPTIQEFAGIVLDVKKVFTATKEGRYTQELHADSAKLVPKLAKMFKQVQDLFSQEWVPELLELEAFAILVCRHTSCAEEIKAVKSLAASKRIGDSGV